MPTMKTQMAQDQTSNHFSRLRLTKDSVMLPKLIVFSYAKRHQMRVTSSLERDTDFVTHKSFVTKVNFNVVFSEHDNMRI